MTSIRAVAFVTTVNAVALSNAASGDMVVALGYDQWNPSLATPISLTAGEWQLNPIANIDGRWEGLSAFFSGGGWNSWQWNVAIWSSSDASTHNTTNENRIAWFQTNLYGNPSAYDTTGATEAFNAALAGDRAAGTTGYPGTGPYRFTVSTSGTYYFGIWDSDLTNNRGGVFFNLVQVPSPAVAPLALLATLLSRGRRRA